MRSELWFRIKALLLRRRMDAELDEELRFHLECQAEKYVAAGMAREEAWRRARMDVDGVEVVKEETRDSWGVRFLHTTMQDVKYAFRVLAKSRVFAAAVIASLALGIGANTAVFTLMDALLWRMPPVENPDRLLVVAWREAGSLYSGFTYQEFEQIRDAQQVVDVAGYGSTPLQVSIDGPPEPSVRGQLVTGRYFELLGVRPVLGRAIGVKDDRLVNGHPVLMLSYEYWERRFARDTSVLGRSIRVSGLPFTVIGVTPRGFAGIEVGSAPDMFLPIMMQPAVMPTYENLLRNPIVGRTWVETIARTKDGFTAEEAAAALDAIIHHQRRGVGPKGSAPPFQVLLTPPRAVSALGQRFSQPLFILLGMVGVLLMATCANVANLFLARAASRRAEFAMRLSLGAGRFRLMRQLVVESLVLAALGGASGVLLARWATGLLVVYLSSGSVPIRLDLSPNARILTFTAAVSVATGLLFGLMPAWRAARIDLSPALRSARASVMSRLQPGRMLAIVQLALTLPLLVGAALFVRSLEKMSGNDASGLRQSVVILRVEPRGSDQRNIPGVSERLDRTYRDLIRRVREIPGVALVSMSNGSPSAPTSTAGAQVITHTGESLRLHQLMVYPNYFATMAIPFVRGRDFEAAELEANAMPVCIVNEAFARRVFGEAEAIGKPCMMDRRARELSNAGSARPPVPYTIVGVVQDSRYTNPRGEVQPLIFTPFLQTGTGRGQMVLHARVQANAGDVWTRIREEVSAVDSSTPMFEIHTLQQELDAALVQQRLIAMLSSVFGGLALVLACVGLYGLMSFRALQRTAEVGIRMALGAGRWSVIWLVVKEALLLVGIGIAAGVPAALIAARVASSQIAGLLFGLEATDPLSIGISAGVLLAVAAVAAYLPARRASLVDPNVVLRAE